MIASAITPQPIKAKRQLLRAFVSFICDLHFRIDVLDRFTNHNVTSSTSSTEISVMTARLSFHHRPTQLLVLLSLLAFQATAFSQSTANYWLCLKESVRKRWRGMDEKRGGSDRES